MSTLYYSVTVRDKDGKLYKNNVGQKVLDFRFEDNTHEDFVELVCRQTYLDYKAICKEGSIIDIEVRSFNTSTKTYSLLYSFYGAENRFIRY